MVSKRKWLIDSCEFLFVKYYTSLTEGALPSPLYDQGGLQLQLIIYMYMYVIALATCYI